MGGFSLYVQDGKLHYTYSLMGVVVTTLTSEDKLPTGKVDVRYEFTADARPNWPRAAILPSATPTSRTASPSWLTTVPPFRMTSYASGMAWP